jgi:hypothetical protein
MHVLMQKQQFTAEPKWQFRSFFEEVDAMCPRYIAPPVAEINGQAGGAVMYAEGTPAQRMINSLCYDLKTGEALRGEFSMPNQQYVRALDPNGHIMPLQIKTTQIAAEDGTGYHTKKVGEKLQQGWLILERNPAEYDLGFANVTGKAGEEYAEFCRDQWLARREKYTAGQARNEESFKSAALRAIEEQSARQGEMLERQLDVTRSMAKDIAEAVGGKGSAGEVEALKAQVAQLTELVTKLVKDKK